MSRTSRVSRHLNCVETPSAVRPTPDELAEFERLDAMAPVDEDGQTEDCKQAAKMHGRRR
jgi:hypothetical protein